jgi:hypothetical protein
VKVLRRPIEAAAKRRPLAQRKASPKGAAVGTIVTSYAFLRLAIPTKPSSPEPKSHTAPGKGTAVGTNPLMSAILPIRIAAWRLFSGSADSQRLHDEAQVHPDIMSLRLALRGLQNVATRNEKSILVLVPY